MAEVIVHLRIEHKSFRTDDGELPVLGPIELTLGAREIVAIVGPSGCGKTTLLRIIGGLDRDFVGTVDWRDGAIPRIGTVFQEPRLLPWRTVRENLLLAQPTTDAQLADHLLEALDLTPFRDAFPRTLSLGMARRVATARAFAIRPELVLLDEPFVSLDANTAARSKELLLSAWRERPVGGLLVTRMIKPRPWRWRIAFCCSGNGLRAFCRKSWCRGREALPLMLRALVLRRLSACAHNSAVISSHSAQTRSRSAHPSPSFELRTGRHWLAPRAPAAVAASCLPLRAALGGMS